MLLIGWLRSLLQFLIRDEESVARINDVWIRTFALELGIVRVIVDDAVAGKTVLLSDARQAFTLRY